MFCYIPMKKDSYPLVSVIIPNYNHANYLDERIQSILNQTYTNIEIIFLDDCSTDNSMEIINKYKRDERITAVIQNESNIGSPFSQWKKGLSIAKGNIIWIAESDDVCDNTFLEKLLNWYISNDLVMAFSLSRVMDSNGMLGDVIQKGILNNIIMNGDNYISNHISLITNASSAIFSRLCALKIDNNYYEYKGAGDWLFWSGIASQGQVGVFAQPLNYYRVHDNNTTSKMFNNGRNFFELKKVYSFLLDKGYWSRWNYYKKCLKMVYSIKYIYKFENGKIKDDLLNEWSNSKYQKWCFSIIVGSCFRLKKFIKK